VAALPAHPRDAWPINTPEQAGPAVEVAAERDHGLLGDFQTDVAGVGGVLQRVGRLSTTRLHRCIHSTVPPGHLRGWVLMREKRPTMLRIHHKLCTTTCGMVGKLTPINTTTCALNE
jgi:hypothetical protein